MITDLFIIARGFQRRYRRRTFEYIFCTWKYSANESTQRQDHRNAERRGFCQVISLFLALMSNSFVNLAFYLYFPFQV